MEERCSKLQSFSLTSLVEPLRLVAEWHPDKKDGDFIYEYEGNQVYKSFANEMAQVMNEMWESGAVNHGNNVSKDKRIMIRSVHTVCTPPLRKKHAHAEKYYSHLPSLSLKRGRESLVNFDTRI